MNKKQDLPTVALSIRQPWAWLICHSGKDIENRDWRTNFRGRFLIHTGIGMTHDEYDEAQWYAENYSSNPDQFPKFKELQRGGIVGVAEIVDCVSESDSPWFFGDYGFVLKNAEPLDFIPCKGKLGFFKPDLSAA